MELERIINDHTEIVSLRRITEREQVESEDIVAKEFPLTIIIDDQELVTLLCSPGDMKYLALGFLASEGLIKSRNEVRDILLDEVRGIVRVETDGTTHLDGSSIFKRFITSGCGKGAAFYSAVDATQTKVESNTKVSPPDIYDLMKEFQHRSTVFHKTGGVHSAALSDGKSLIVFKEDIGRHNAIDKIFGECLWEDIPTEGRLILTSGRISSEILFKLAKRGVPIVVSRSAPTNLAVSTASELGISIVGFARGHRMNVYSNEWRIEDGKG